MVSGCHLSGIMGGWEYYEEKSGFHFTIAKHWILATTDKTVVESAYDRAELMYEKYQYDD